MVLVEFVDNLKNLNIFAFRICVNLRRTQRPLFFLINLIFCMLTILLTIITRTEFKVNQLKLQTQWNLKFAENHKIVDLWSF